jgi:hypothetical protein
MNIDVVFPQVEIGQDPAGSVTTRRWCLVLPFRGIVRRRA